MLYYLAPYLTHVWGPFRLLESHLVLMGVGATVSAFLVGWLLPRLWHRLPRDRGREHAVTPEAAVGKPTGAGFICVLLLLPVLLLVLPLSLRMFCILGCLLLAMLTGYLDDRSEKPWGEYFKGLLDLGVAFLTSLAMCQFKPVVFWLPLIKGDFLVPVWLFLLVGTLVLWMTINATNCTDGIDGLAGTLTLLSLFYLAGFLYIVIGHKEMAAYFLVWHNPDGARWSVLLVTTAGALAGYLWFNAQPSKVMMGDAGSRFLGLLVGVAALAAGNPFLVLVVAPVALVNGGSGIVKVALLRLFRLLKFDVRSPHKLQADAAANGGVGDVQQNPVVVILHKVRFPLHDHCRKNLGWSNPQVLLRFFLIQCFLTPILLGLLIKLR